MPWGERPSTDAADAIRALIGDTDADSPLLADDTYELIQAQESRLYGQASLGASILAGKYAKSMTRKVGGFVA
jgi:hypothetical protein